MFFILPSRKQFRSHLPFKAKKDKLFSSLRYFVPEQERLKNYAFGKKFPLGDHSTTEVFSFKIKIGN